MNGKFSIKYFNRVEEVLKTEPVFADRFLYWLYNARSGSFVNEKILRHKVISKLYGWYHKHGLSRTKIKPFAQKMDVSLEELKCSIEDFMTFNDFFTRTIDFSKRPINRSPNICIAPVDGKILAYQSVDPDMTFRIKRSVFNLRSFLRDDTLVEIFNRGSMVVSRLSLRDYHHFHFPDSGIPGEAISIEGKYYASGPYALRTLIPFYSENYRMLTLFDSEHFGQIGMIEIGAFTVGSIRQRYRPGIEVGKGGRKGFFEVGGSTVVLLFEKGRIEIDRDLCINTRNDIETYVLLGDSIGSTPGCDVY